MVVSLSFELESQGQDLFSQFLDFSAILTVFTEKFVEFTLGRLILLMDLLIEGRRVWFLVEENQQDVI